MNGGNEDGNGSDRRQAGRAGHEERRRRLKVALRENLKRRKSQAREKDESTISSPNSDDLPSGGTGKNHPGK
jgi:hypothetical protein